MKTTEHDDDPLVGREIDGRFRLLRLLGAGGMGRVYAGNQSSVGREVAVKVLRSDLSDIASLRNRFFREARLIGSLRHPNIVGCIDYGEDDALGALYLVMDLVHGRPLSSLLERGRLPVPVALTICRQICSGLAEAHGAGIVHRDLKPENVMLQVTAEGKLHATILDFGIALPRGRDETRFTATGAVLGTPHYMSPEQAKDRPVTQKSDLFALGVITYEMLTGQLPFVADTPIAVLFKTVNEHPTPLSEMLADDGFAPDPVAEFVHELLAKDPEERPPSASAAGRRIDGLMTELGLAVPVVESLPDLDSLVIPLAEPLAATAATPVAVFDESDPRHAEPPATAPTRGSSAGLLVMLVLVIGGLLCATAVAAVLVWNVLHEEEPEPEPVATTVAAREPVPDAPASLDETIESFDAILEKRPEPQQGAAAPEPEPEPPKGKRTKKHKKPKKKKHKKPDKHPKPKKHDRKPPAAGGQKHAACQGRTCDIELAADGHAACQTSSTCTVTCRGGGCAQVCQSGSDCTFDCAGGGCRQTCFDGTTCTLTCAGGDCERSTFDGADVTIR